MTTLPPTGMTFLGRTAGAQGSMITLGGVLGPPPIMMPPIGGDGVFGVRIFGTGTANGSTGGLIGGLT